MEYRKFGMPHHPQHLVVYSLAVSACSEAQSKRTHLYMVMLHFQECITYSVSCIVTTTLLQFSSNVALIEEIAQLQKVLKGAPVP